MYVSPSKRLTMRGEQDVTSAHGKLGHIEFGHI